MVGLFPDVVVDTMALVLRLEKRRMPERSKSYFEEVEANSIRLFIPAMVLAEIGYLSERKRIDCSLGDVKIYLQQFSSVEVYPLTLDVIQTAFQVLDIPELHDRLIAATASYLNLSLVTNDPVITASASVRTIWG